MTVRRLLRRPTLGLPTAYVATLLAYAAARPRVRAAVAPLELIDDFSPWWYLPVPIIAAAGCVLRCPLLLVSGLAAAAAFARTWGPLFRRRQAPCPHPTDGLTVMSFNVLAWNRRHAELAEAILAADADVVGLQELHAEIADALDVRLLRRYPHRALHPTRNTSGSGILSRHPLRDVATFRLSDHGHWCHRAIVDAPAGPLTVFSIRTPVPRVPRPPRRRGSLRLVAGFQPWRRRIEILRLLDMVRHARRPVVVAGDFNLTEYSPDYQLLRSELGDAYRAVGPGFGHTFPRIGSFPSALPAPWPVLRLDYVWYSPELRPVAARLGHAGGSDHLPVVVRFVRIE